MKTWNTPAIEELEINETMGGGRWSTNHDDVVYTGTNPFNGKTVKQQEFEMVSGV